jgi:hypothetical protein
VCEYVEELLTRKQMNMNGKQRPRINNFGGDAHRRPRLDMGCSAIEEE